MKRILNVLLAALLLTCALPTALAEASPEAAYADQFIDLRGEWHVKVYRKYANMYQYFAYGGCPVTWTDDAVAALPSADAYETWEKIAVPAADYATGGLLQMYRAGTDDDVRDRLTENELFPKWSEAWFCKTVEIPAGFVKEGEVTLMLGVIDDIDVAYVNGTPVGQSGFKAADGAKADPQAVPELGGFAPEGDFQFEKSYWEVSREYVFDASLLKEGKNEICIRLYNNNSFGGFYDRAIALVATRPCVNFLKNLPVDGLPDAAAYERVVRAQIAAIEGEDIAAYAATLSDDYHENELNKEEQVARMQAIFDAYERIRVEDVAGAYYTYRDAPVYFASRVVKGVKDGAEAVILSNPEMIQYFTADGAPLERGNRSHCYTVSYASSLPEMGGKELLYSVYLPPSYYETDKAYPVVTLLHGINSTGDSFVNVDKIEARMNEWIASGLIQEMIVVMPNSGKSSGYVDTPAEKGVSDSAGPWASHIYIDILAQTDGNYRTLPQKEFRAMSGISMGGGGVFKIGMAHTDIYTSFASHMGAVGDYRACIDAIPADALPSIDFYLDCGYDDQMVSPENTKAAGEYLESIGANVIWTLRDGAHNSAFYMAGMPASMKMHSDHFVKNGLLDVWAE